MRHVDKQTRALRDLVEIFVYLAETAGLPVAEKFLEMAEWTFSLLAKNSNMGEIANLKGGKVAGLRKFPVPLKGLKYLVFYLPTRDGITVVRVIHSSQDWWEAD
jgi:toxin ParE1/3/4